MKVFIFSFILFSNTLTFSQVINIDSLFNIYSKDSIIEFAFKGQIIDTASCKKLLNEAVNEYNKGQIQIPDYYYLSSFYYNRPFNKYWFAFSPDHTFKKLFEKLCNCDVYRTGGSKRDEQLFQDKFFDDRLREIYGYNYMSELKALSDSLNKNGLGFIESSFQVNDSILNLYFTKCYNQHDISKVNNSILIALSVDQTGKILKSKLYHLEIHEYIPFDKVPVKLELFLMTVQKLPNIRPAMFYGKPISDDLLIFFDIREETLFTQ